MTMQLASRFRNASGIRADMPLSDDQIRAVAPSIFAEAAHESRSARYTYIPTIDVLNGLRKEGFQPFMVCQTRVRNEEKREHTKHMIRLRHADQIAGREANETPRPDSHRRNSRLQVRGGIVRFCCYKRLGRCCKTRRTPVQQNGD